MAILKGAPNAAAAKSFVRFVMSDAGQKLWLLKQGAPGGPVASQLNRFTVLPDLYSRYQDEAAVTLNPFEWKSDLQYDSALGGGRWGVLNDLIGILVIDSHRVLRSAWTQAMEDGVTKEEIQSLSKPPVSEAEALALGENWRDPELRSRTIATWTAFVRKKYGEPQEPFLVQALNFFTLFFPVGIAGAMVVYLWYMRRV